VLGLRNKEGKKVSLFVVIVPNFTKVTLNWCSIGYSVDEFIVFKKNNLVIFTFLRNTIYVDSFLFSKFVFLILA